MPKLKYGYLVSGVGCQVSGGWTSKFCAEPDYLCRIDYPLWSQTPAWEHTWNKSAGFDTDSLFSSFPHSGVKMQKLLVTD